MHLLLLYKTAIISESSDVYSRIIDKMVSLNIDINNSPIQKLLKFVKSDKHHPVERMEEEDVIKQFQEGSRLIWFCEECDDDYNLPGFEILDNPRMGKLVFKPENRDIAELLLSIENDDPTSQTHLLNGLAFGYPPDDVLDFVARHEREITAIEKLKKVGIEVPYAYVHEMDGIIWINYEPEDLNELRKELKERKLEIIEPSSPPFPPHQLNYFIGVRL